jgi:hypothetical protein
VALGHVATIVACISPVPASFPVLSRHSYNW